MLETFKRSTLIGPGSVEVFLYISIGKPSKCYILKLIARQISD